MGRKKRANGDNAAPPERIFETREYLPHEYSIAADRSGRHYCVHRCGCYCTGSKSDGPPTIDPDGECPNRPKHGPRFNARKDLMVVAGRRILKLRGQLAQLAEEKGWLTIACSTSEREKSEIAERIKALLEQNSEMAGEIRILAEEKRRLLAINEIASQTIDGLRTMIQRLTATTKGTERDEEEKPDPLPRASLPSS